MKKRIIFRVPDKMRENINKAVANGEAVSVSELIRLAVSEFLNTMKNQDGNSRSMCVLLCLFSLLLFSLLYTLIHIHTHIHPFHIYIENTARIRFVFLRFSVQYTQTHTHTRSFS